MDYMKASLNEWLKWLLLHSNMLQSLRVKKSLPGTFKHQTDNSFHISENPLFITLTLLTPRERAAFFAQILCH